MTRLTFAIASSILLVHAVRGATLSLSGVRSRFNVLNSTYRLFLVSGP
jgi:hypothetical protein